MRSAMLRIEMMWLAISGIGRRRPVIVSTNPWLLRFHHAFFQELLDGGETLVVSGDQVGGFPDVHPFDASRQAVGADARR